MLARLDYVGRKPDIDVGPVFSALCAELADASAVNPLHCRLQLDWIQYRFNFRAPIAMRPFLGTRDAAPEAEFAVDVRRMDACDLGREFHTLLDANADAWDDTWLALEASTAPTESVIWVFNRLYWEHLSLWEMTFQQDYAAALPGGVSDGTNRDFWEHQVGSFVDVLDGLATQELVPDEIFVLELGVGSGNQARIWLDTFRLLTHQRGRDYYARLRYLMADYSADVLTTAREVTGEHRNQVSTLNLDAMNVIDNLKFLRNKVLFVHSCNLYDNLPTDEIALFDGDLFRVQVRAAIRKTDVASICVEHGIDVGDFLPTVQRLLRIGPEIFDDAKSGVRFWADVWRAIVLDEQYVRTDAAEVALVDDGSVTLQDVIGVLPASGRCHLSTGALRSFANTLPLLHPRGRLQVQDLFVTKATDYSGAFRGPGKLDGSVINWLNGPLFCAVADRLGFHVRFEAFSRFREASNTVVLTTAAAGGDIDHVVP
jgi:hypothetical protein